MYTLIYRHPFNQEDVVIKDSSLDTMSMQVEYVLDTLKVSTFTLVYHKES